jgi:serine/threonine protein kinase/Flp pilus assembly protein TadD
MIGRLFGSYRILELIGEGGMGVVYRARDERLGRLVAVKLVKESQLTDESVRARLLREARLASSLNHPNICTIYEVGEADGIAYIGMENVAGRSLCQLASSGGLPTETVLRYGIQISDALAHAHERAVIHRDLKTANMVVTPEGRVKVLDFGLARREIQPEFDQSKTATAPLTGEGAVVGTLHYLAPELLRGKPADAQSDIWALGVVLYELASGSLPFRGGTAFEVSSAILEQPFQPLPAKVPSGLRAVIQRCLSKEPAQRYQRSIEVRAALEILSVMEQSTDSLRTLPEQPKTPASGLRTRRGTSPSPNHEANEYFEKGMMFMQGQLDLPRARRMLERALDLDPHFANARAVYGLTFLLLLETGQSNDPSLIYKAEEEERRALSDDSSCSFARGAVAAVYFQQGRKELVPAVLDEALNQDPACMPARMWSMVYHLSNGDYLAASDTGRKILEDNPTFWPARMYYGETFREQAQFAEALREQEKVLEQDPANAMALRHIARVQMDMGDLAGARVTLEGMRQELRPNYRVRLAWAILLALEGRESEALREMDPGVQRYAEVHVLSTVEAAAFYALMNQTEQALAWLDRAVRNGDERASYFRSNPLLISLREHPVFQQILTSLELRRQP